MAPAYTLQMAAAKSDLLPGEILKFAKDHALANLKVLGLCSEISIQSPDDYALT